MLVIESGELKVAREKIRAGYKKTEVGVIPEDWEIKHFYDICTINQGLQIAIEKRKLQYTPKSKKYITIQFLAGQKRTEYIDDYNTSVCCNVDDILMTRTGNTGIVVTGVSGVFHNNFFKINYNTKQINKKYLVYYLQSKQIQKMILDRAGTSTIPDLNHKDFYTLPIIICDINEQQAIANALSDIDNLIFSLEKLIDKKKNIKQGAMQELLTDKKKFYGFSGQLEEKKIGDIFDVTAGGDLCTESFSTFMTDNNRYKVFSNAITDKGFYGYTSNYKYQRDTITVTARGSVGYANYRNEKYDAIGRLLVLNPKIQVNCYFIVEYINNRIDFISESTGVPQLTAPQISSYILKIPNYKEQTAIAQILSDMDTEIEKLNAKLDKYKEIKQGMMQELLTGKRRLI